MLSIQQITNVGERLNYYVEMAAAHYYDEEGASPGEWSGRGAKLLGLEGKVNPAELKNLLMGFSPDGKTALVKNAGASDRQMGWDLTFSAPKSVSVLYSQSSEEMQAKLVRAHHSAVKKTIERIENEIGWTRRGKGGVTLETVDLVISCYFHITSRLLDPQFHTHAIFKNIGARKDGSFGTIISKGFYQRKMEFGAFYRARLAEELELLGLKLKKSGDTFEIEGVPSDLCEEFSKRRRQIKKVLVEKGLTSAVAAKIAALATRPNKKHVAEEKLFAEWRAVGASYGWSTAEAEALVSSNRIQAAKPEEHQAASNTKQSAPRKAEQKTTATRPPEGNASPTQGNKDGHTSAAHKGIKNQSENVRKGSDSNTNKADRSTTQQKQTESEKENARADSANNSDKKRVEQKKSSKTNQKAGSNKARSDTAKKNSNERPSKNPWLNLVGLQVRYHKVAPQAPMWNPVRKWKVPYLAPTQRANPIKTVYSKDLPFVKFTVQISNAFPKAHKWHPFSIIRLPRVAFKILTPEEKKAVKRARFRSSGYTKDDRVRFKENIFQSEVKRGDAGTVAKVKKTAMWVKLDSGKTVHISFKEGHEITNLTKLQSSREQFKRQQEARTKEETKQTSEANRERVEKSKREEAERKQKQEQEEKRRRYNSANQSYK